MGIPVYESRDRDGDSSDMRELRGRRGDFVKYFFTEGVNLRGWIQHMDFSGRVSS